MTPSARADVLATVPTSHPSPLADRMPPAWTTRYEHDRARLLEQVDDVDDRRFDDALRRLREDAFGDTQALLVADAFSFPEDVLAFFHTRPQYQPHFLDLSDAPRTMRIGPMHARAYALACERDARPPGRRVHERLRLREVVADDFETVPSLLPVHGGRLAELLNATRLVLWCDDDPMAALAWLEQPLDAREASVPGSWARMRVGELRQLRQDVRAIDGRSRVPGRDGDLGARLFGARRSS